jgi:acetyltransferase-like isoleucine patch superfamily enzyme
MSIHLSTAQALLAHAGFDEALIRFLPATAGRAFQTVPLAETQLARDLDAEFDETCLLTVWEGGLDKFSHVRLAGHPGKRRYSGVHLSIFGTRGQLNVTLADDHVKLVVGSHTIVRANIQMFGRPRLFIGDGTTIGQARIIAANADVVLGDDCQLSDEIILQSSDQHPIMDMDTGEVLNAQRHFIHVDRHVWIGRRAMIMPDVRIAEGSIVAAAAVVTQNVPPHAIVAGLPARVVRERVTWAREFQR